MRIKATDPEAEKVIAVLVDGKRVSMPLEANEEEGWCIAAIPVSPSMVHEIEKIDIEADNPLDVAEAEFKTVTLHGVVRIILAEDNDERMG